jgi:hypothetical protein
VPLHAADQEHAIGVVGVPVHERFYSVRRRT